MALPSPLRADASLDSDLFLRHAQQLFAQGIDGVVAFGTTGEGPSFSAAERLKGLEVLLQGGIDRSRIGLGCGFPAVSDTASLVTDALCMGITHVLMLPPFFFRDVSASGIEEAFCAIFDRIGDHRMRASLYHIPQLSGVRVPPEVAARLRERYGPMVAGIKDSSGDFAHFRSFRKTVPNLPITMGSEAFICRALAEGASGTICGLGNIAPALVRSMFEGRAAEVVMESLVSLFGDRPFESTLKTVIAAQTGDPSWRRVRAPLQASPPEEGERIAKWLLAHEWPEAAFEDRRGV